MKSEKEVRERLSFEVREMDRLNNLPYLPLGGGQWRASYAITDLLRWILEEE